MNRLRDFELEVYFSDREFRVRHHMSSSHADSVSVGELLEFASPADRMAFESLSLGYTPSSGAYELRHAIASTYDGLQGQDIMVFTGAEEAIFATTHVLLNPDDHAIVVVPAYQSLETAPASICEVSAVALRETQNWRLDLQELVDQIRPNTRLILINFPNNPTGKILERPLFLELLDVARDRDIYVFSDEIYRGMEHDPQARLPQAVDVCERAISLGAMSKSYGLPGLRIGWVACRDRKLLQRLERFRHYLTLCNPAPSERLALIALRSREKILARNRGIVSANLDLLRRFLGEHPETFEWSEPDGGCTAFPRYVGTHGVEAYCRRLVEEADVLLVPGRCFGSRYATVPNDRFRVGFGRASMPHSLDAWRAYQAGRP